MIYKHKKLSFLILFFGLLIISSVFNEKVIVAQEQSTYFNFEQEKSVLGFYTKLNGEWQFFERALLTPDTPDVNDLKSTIVILPDSFKNQTGLNNTFGTYRTTLKIPGHFIGKGLALHIPYEYGAYKLFVNDTELLEAGIVGQDQQTHQTEMAPQTAYFSATDREIDLIIQVSSFEHIRGGLEVPIYFGDATAINERFMRQMNANVFINSSIFIVGIFIFSYVLFRKTEVTLSVFGLFCVLIAIRSLFADPFYYTILIPELSWIWGTRLEYLLTIASSWVFVILMYLWHEEFSKVVTLFLSAVHFLLLVVTLFTQPVIFQTLFFNVFYLTIPTFIYLVYIIYKGIKQNQSNAIINGIGIFLIFIAFFNDFAIGNDWYQFYTLMLPATGLYVLLHLVKMSQNFAKLTENREKVNKKLVLLNTSLDEQVHSRTIELQEANELLQQQAFLDSLTGIQNRRSFNEMMQKCYKEAIEQERGLSVLMMDLDQFKEYNDYFGHLKGDMLLQELVKVIEDQLEPEHFFARYGGEEFIIILPDVTYDMAYTLANKVRQAVQDEEFDHPMGEHKVVTISIGVASMIGKPIYQSDIALIDAADQQLYVAKESGRNCVK